VRGGWLGQRRRGLPGWGDYAIGCPARGDPAARFLFARCELAACLDARHLGCLSSDARRVRGQLHAGHGPLKVGSAVGDLAGARLGLGELAVELVHLTQPRGSRFLCLDRVGRPRYQIAICLARLLLVIVQLAPVAHPGIGVALAHELGQLALGLAQPLELQSRCLGKPLGICAALVHLGARGRARAAGGPTGGQGGRSGEMARAIHVQLRLGLPEKPVYGTDGGYFQVPAAATSGSPRGVCHQAWAMVRSTAVAIEPSLSHEV